MNVDLMEKHAPKPWALFIALLLAAALGSIAVPVQIILSRQSHAASQQQVSHNEDVIRQAAKITHNRLADLCRQTNRVLAAHHLPLDACPSPEP